MIHLLRRFFDYLLLLLMPCGMSAQASLPAGYWHAELQLNDSTILPFVFQSFGSSLEIINAGERIRVDEITYSSDSVFIQMPFFETEFRCSLSERRLEGVYLNHSRTVMNKIPFRAIHGMGWRFSDRPEKTAYDLSGRWHVVWGKEKPEHKMSIGIFSQEGNRLTGTFLTPTGDYRYLEGEVSGSLMKLSAFDASHAYLFDAIIKADGSLEGNYYSGAHWHDSWIAWRSDSAQLSDPESLTFLKSGYDGLTFSFPDENGNLFSLPDQDYDGKVVLVQLMGTWCSNCLDETTYLMELHSKYPQDKFSIIALDFERTRDTLRIKNNIRRLKERLGIKYPVLYAGNSQRDEAAKSLPMLNHIAAYPTTIVLDKKGKVRKIHTGFSGPATGSEYENFKISFESFIEKLLSE